MLRFATKSVLVRAWGRLWWVVRAITGLLRLVNIGITVLESGRVAAWVLTLLKFD